MDTGYQSNEEGLDFGLPYLMIRKPHPYDTTTLNFNWQVWDTCTFSVFSRTTDFIDESSAELAAESILRFLATRGMLRSKVPESVLRFLAEKGMLGREIPEGSKTKIVKEEELINIHNKKGGILIRYHHPADFVRAGNLLAEIIDPYTTEVREKIGRHTVFCPSCPADCGALHCLPADSQKQGGIMRKQRIKGTVRTGLERMKSAFLPRMPEVT